MDVDTGGGVGGALPQIQNFSLQPAQGSYHCPTFKIVSTPLIKHIGKLNLKFPDFFDLNLMSLGSFAFDQHFPLYRSLIVQKYQLSNGNSLLFFLLSYVAGCFEI